MIWDNAAIATLRDLWTRGLSASEIGRQMGATKNSIIGRAHRMGLEERASPVAPKIVTPALREAVVQCLQNDMSAAAIMRVIGVTRQSILRIQADQPLPVQRAAPTEPMAYRLPRPVAPKVEASIVEAPTIVYAAPRPVRLFSVECRGQCQWMDGTGPFIQCESVVAREEGMKPPYSYCGTHRKAAYTNRYQEEVAA